MKTQLLNALIKTRTDIAAPIAGGGFAWISWIELALPLLSFISIIVGLVLGITTFVLREKRESLRHKEWVKEHCCEDS